MGPLCPTPKSIQLQIGTKQEALPGGSPMSPRLNFKTPCVGVYKCVSLIGGFAVTVAIWPREVVSCRNFILHAVATFWAMSLVGIYPGTASNKSSDYCYSIVGARATSCNISGCYWLYWSCNRTHAGSQSGTSVPWATPSSPSSKTCFLWHNLKIKCREQITDKYTI